MNVCPELERETTVVLVWPYEKERDITHTHTHTWDLTETWKSTLGWCQTLQPACSFSPPCGCFPIQLGDPGFSCKLMRVFYTAAIDAATKMLTIRGRKTCFHNYHYNAVVAQLVPPLWPTPSGDTASLYSGCLRREVRHRMDLNL